MLHHHIHFTHRVLSLKGRELLLYCVFDLQLKRKYLKINFLNYILHLVLGWKTERSAAEGDDVMAFNEKDFLEIEYDAWDKENGTLISTTSEQHAKDAGIYNKDARYGPSLVILGTHSIIKGLDRELRGMEMNSSKKFVFAPEDAFGARQEDLVRVMPLSEFRARNINPYPGMHVDLEDANAIVKSVNSGRVVVDLNHDFAGHSIEYEVKVVHRLDKPEEKIASLGRTYAAEPTKVEISGGAAVLEYGSKVSKNIDYFIGRANVIAASFSYIDGISKVQVKEEYEKAMEEKKAGEKEGDAAE